MSVNSPTMMEDEFVDESLVNKFFKLIKRKSGNGRCADCGDTSPAWVSVTHGFLICTGCAAKHRELGVRVSKVKSTVFDTWMVSELRRVYVSGNSNLWKLERTPDVRSKYTNAEWYALLVDDLSKKSMLEEPGICFIDNLSKRKEKSLEPQKIFEEKMPKFSDVKMEKGKEGSFWGIQEEVSPVMAMEKPISIKRDVYPSLQKHRKGSFNFQSKDSDARKLGFGALNVLKKDDFESTAARSKLNNNGEKGGNNQ